MRVFCVRIARKYARVRIARKYARAPTARKTGFWGTKSGLNVPQTFEIRGVGAHSERKMPQRALFSVFGARFLTNLCPKVPKFNELGHASGYTCPNFHEKGILGYKNLQNVSQTRKIGGFGTCRRITPNKKAAPNETAYKYIILPSISLPAQAS